MSATFPSLNIKIFVAMSHLISIKTKILTPSRKRHLYFDLVIYPVVLQIIKENQRHPILREKPMLN